jgi:hypothetical protein
LLGAGQSAARYNQRTPAQERLEMVRQLCRLDPAANIIVVSGEVNLVGKDFRPVAVKLEADWVVSYRPIA